METVTGSTGERLLQEAYGTSPRAQRFYANQMLDHLNAKMRKFVGRQEMMFVSTSDSQGACDCTFRAGPPGFVTVLGERRLVWPEYRGNGVMASLGNLTENGQVGLLFLDFFRDVIGLHVNGRAEIVEEAAIRRLAPDIPVDRVPGRRAERWVQVHVEEAYVHCRKHIPHLAKQPRRRSWGTDDAQSKGGDYFEVTEVPARSAAIAPTWSITAMFGGAVSSGQRNTPKNGARWPLLRPFWSRKRG